MPRTNLEQDDQLAIDEKVIFDADVEQALETRQRAKEELAEKRLALKNTTEIAKQMISRLEMPDPEDETQPVVVRIGRHRITKKFVKGRTVSFATEDRVQMTIGLADKPDVDDVEDEDPESVAEDAVAKLEDSRKPARRPTALEGGATDTDTRLVN